MIFTDIDNKCSVVFSSMFWLIFFIAETSKRYEISKHHDQYEILKTKWKNILFSGEEMSSQVDLTMMGDQTSPSLPQLKEGQNSLVSPSRSPQSLTPRQQAVTWAADVRKRYHKNLSFFFSFLKDKRLLVVIGYEFWFLCLTVLLAYYLQVAFVA